MENCSVSRCGGLLKTFRLLGLSAVAALALQAPVEGKRGPSNRVTVSPVYWGDFIVGGYGQTVILRSPRELLATDPRAFARWLETERPKPVSAQYRADILRMLPADGQVTSLSDAGHRKLAALGQLLRATGHDSDYEIKVIDIPQAKIGVLQRSVILISENALALIDGKDVQALMAHELGHEYIWAEYQRASKRGDHNRLKQIELMCDAIAIVILDGLGLDPSRLMTGVEIITRYNREFRGPALDERDYPTLSERRTFARAVTAWVAGAPSGL